MIQPSLAIFCAGSSSIIASIFHRTSLLSQNQIKIHDKLISMGKQVGQL